MWKMFVVFFFLILASDAQEKKQSFHSILKNSKLHIFSDQSTSTLAPQIATAWSEIEQTVHRSLGVLFPRKVLLYLCTQDDWFKEHLGSYWPYVSAVALSDSDQIMLRTNQISPIHNHWQATLTHEFVHLVLIEYERTQHKEIPKWYHEGTAEAVSGQGHFDNEQMDLALNSYQGRLPPLEHFSKTFKTSESEFRLAYAVSRSICGYLENQYGKEIHQKILRQLKTAPDFTTAFHQATGDTLKGVEAKWKAALKSSFSWMGFLWMGGTLLMMLPVVLTFILYRQRRKRRRELYEKWEKEGEEEFWEV